MAELFSPVWIIERQEITDLEKYNAWDFNNSILTTFVETFSGELREVKQRVKELLQDEPIALSFPLRKGAKPKVSYQYKLNKP